MCGIAGYYFTNGKKVTNTQPVLKMLELQRHRGPDDSGVRAFSLLHANSKEFSITAPENINGDFEGMFGFNRLSILDLSKNGHQPMCSNDEKVILMLNGEIYNAFDYKDELIKDGYHFKSTSDTEVVLALYLKHGFEKMLQLLNGMFAIALSDLRSQTLYIARDRFGIKPVYLLETADMFAFSSEMKSFTALEEFTPQLNTELVDEYLLFRNNINRTLFKGIRFLPPGSFIEYTPSEGLTEKVYFNSSDYVRKPDDKGIDHSVELVENALKESVRRQLISDVKLGCQLSGGIDSSLVVYYAKMIKKDDLLESISITLPDKFFNEEPYMDTVINKVDVKAHKFLLDADYYLNHLEKAAWHFEAPVSHPNAIGIYYLSQCAKNYVTVLLSGEGADEVFGGYMRFATVSNAYSMQNLYTNFKKYKSLPQFLKLYIDSDYRPIMASSYMPGALARSLKPGFDFEKAAAPRKKLYKSLAGSVTDRQVKYEMKTYLPDLLLRQDKMSMAHSIENRVPFLDNDLVDLSFLLPEEHLVPANAKHHQTKYAFKLLSEKIFGKDFSYRQKQGFGIPLRNFFSAPAFNSYLSNTVLPGIKARGIFDYKVVNRWLSNLGALSPQELESLWIAVSFEIWANKFDI